MVSTTGGTLNPQRDGDARLRLLGTAELDGPVRLRFLPERRFRLLAYLALKGDWVARDQLAHLFWPDRTQDAARSNLRKLLLEVRALEIPNLEFDRSSVRWNIRTDVSDYESAISARDHDAALGHYRGRLLHRIEGGDSEAFSSWLHAERDRLHRAWRDATLARLPQLTPAAARDLAQGLLDDDPFDEDAAVAAIAASRALGDEVGATRTYRAYAGQLVESLGVEPSARVRAAASGSQTSGEPPRTNAATISQSAPEGGDFVGRSRELTELSSMLSQVECRLLTVTGPGGMGKSRLVKQAVRAAATDYADGVIWVALDDLTDVSQVAPRLAAELNTELTARQDPIARLGQVLADRHMLVVFDNSEHLPDLSGLIEALLSAAPRLHVLATSRARIGSAREWLLPLGGLETAPVGAEAAEILRSEAAQLFVAQARSVHPRFDAVSNAPAIGRLVGAVGGMPLAILLAASWVRLLPVVELADDVARSLDLLERGEEGEERPEHRSVRATFDQSWRLLAPAEQRTLGALSVSSGGFTQAAARAIAEVPLSLLASLVDKSLLTCDSDGRFGFHMLVLQYVVEKARSDPAALQASRSRHAAFFCDVLARIDRRASTAEVRIANAAIEQDFENHRRAWRFACSEREANTLARAAPGLAQFCESRGRWQDGVDLFRQAAQATAGDTSPMAKTRAACLTSLAHLLQRQSALQSAESVAREALKLARALRMPDGIQRNLLTIGRVLSDRGDLAPAMPYLRDALTRARRGSESSDTAEALIAVAVIDKQQGRYPEAAAGYEEAMAMLEEAGDAPGTGRVLINLGSMYRAQKQTEKAMPLFERALRLAEENALHAIRAFALTHLALGYYALKRFELSQRYGEQALKVARASGEGHLEPAARAALARGATALGQPAAAKQHLDQMLSNAKDKSLVSLLLAGLAIYAELLGRNGHPLRAATLLAFVVAHPKATEGDQHGARDLYDELGIDESDRKQGEAAAAALELDALVEQALAEPPPQSPVK